MASCFSSQRAVMQPFLVSVDESLLLASRTSDYSVGSTATGDSFCVPIDFDHEHRHDDSLHVDPYLGPKDGRNKQRFSDVRNRRLARARVRQKHGFSPSESSLPSPSPIRQPSPQYENSSFINKEAGSKSFPVTFPPPPMPFKSPQSAKNSSSTSIGTRTTVKTQNSDSSFPRPDFNDEDLPFNAFPKDMNLQVSMPHEPKLATPAHHSISLANSSFDSLDSDMNDPHLVPPHRRKWWRERNFWYRKCKAILEKEPRKKVPLAEAYMHLGHAHRMAGEFRRSEQACGQAAKIWEKLGRKLAMVTALEFQALASASLDVMDAPERAAVFVRRALDVRIELQGPQHVDTITCMHHLGSCYLLASDWPNAHHCFHQVYWMRQLIFGKVHASVAVVAHELGNVCIQLGQLRSARRYLNNSWKLFMDLDVPTGNKAVQLVLKDMKRAERLQHGLSSNNARERIQV